MMCDLRDRESGASEASSTLSEKLSSPGVSQCLVIRRTVTPCSISEGSTSSTAAFSSGKGHTEEPLDTGFTLLWRVALI